MILFKQSEDATQKDPSTGNIPMLASFTTNQTNILLLVEVFPVKDNLNKCIKAANVSYLDWYNKAQVIKLCNVLKWHGLW